MKRKKPYWFKWHYVFSETHVGWLAKDWTWRNRYRTEKARDEAIKNIKSKGHRITEVGCDNVNIGN